MKDFLEKSTERLAGRVVYDGADIQKIPFVVNKVWHINTRPRSKQ